MSRTPARFTQPDIARSLRAPAPLKLPGLDRNIFDRLQLDRAMHAARGTKAVA